jgi:hypothetical protein
MRPNSTTPLSDRVLGFRRGARTACCKASTSRASSSRSCSTGQVQRAAAGTALDHRLRGAGVERRHELEGDRPQFQDYIELKTKDKVNFYKTPGLHPARPTGRLGQGDRRQGAENPHFQKVLDSQKAFARRAGQWQNDYTVDFKMAYNRYFGAQPKKS